MLTIIALFNFSTNVQGHTKEMIAHQEESSGQSCYALDVLFIVDQSSSMSGYGGNPASDPTEQRKYAVEAVIDQLTDISLDRCPGIEHRIAVVSFGSEATVDLSFSNINPSNFEDADQLRELLRRNILAKDMYETHPKLGFEEAKELFDELPTSGNNEIRKRVIIFITDGIPSGAGQTFANLYIDQMEQQIAQDFPFDSSLLKKEQCLDDLRVRYMDLDNAPPESVNTCLSLCPEASCNYSESTYIWMILFKSFEAYPRGLLDTYRNIAESHGGELIELSQNRQDVPTTFRTLLSDLAGVKASLLQCGKFVVNPYLRKATLNVYKLDEDLSVTLSYTDANGTRHEIKQGDSNTAEGFDVSEYYAFGTNERYVFNYPYPGLWDLRADDCSGLDAYYEEVNVNAGYEHRVPSEIPQYDRDPFYDTENPFYMEIQMLDENGRVIDQADHPHFAITPTMTVTLPDGSKAFYDMEWVPNEEIFRAKEPLEIPIPGIYRIDVMGTSFKHEGEPTQFESESYASVFPTEFELFSLEQAELVVFPVIPFKIDILSPENGQYLGSIHKSLLQGGFKWPLPIKPISIEARIVDENNNLLPIDEVLDSPNRALSARIVSDEETTITLTMVSPGYYSGEVDEFDGDGINRIVVSLQSPFNERYRPLSRSVEVEFSRADNLLSNPQFYVVILIVLIVIIILRIIICVMSNNNPVRGELIFYDGTAELQRFSLHVRKMCGKNKRIISQKELASVPSLGLKKMSIKNQGRPSGRKKNQDLVDEELGMFSLQGSEEGQTGVIIKCWPTGNQRSFEMDLTPGIQASFGDVGGVQVKYEV